MPKSKSDLYLNSDVSISSLSMVVPTVRVHTLIVAAGKGQRFGGAIAKQYTRIAGQTVLQHSVANLASSRFVNQVVIVVASNDTLIHELHFSVPITLTHGGAERWQSVHAGMQAIKQSGANNNDLILIHDAARPCVNRDNIDRVITVAMQEDYGAILGVPVTDTLKETGTIGNYSNNHTDKKSTEDKSTEGKSTKDIRQIVKTVDRANLWQAQTPQVFRLGKLIDVLEQVSKDNLAITDEASAFELLNYPIKIVQGDRLNLKLTYPNDIKLLSAILSID